MARKVDDFVSIFGVPRKEFLNMEKRSMMHLTEETYYADLCKPVESRDELGRLIGALMLEPKETKYLRKWCGGLNRIVRQNGRLDGRPPATVVAAMIKLVAEWGNVELEPNVLEQACCVLSNTTTQVAALIAKEPRVQDLLQKAKACKTLLV